MVEDSLFAVKAALENGYVTGGGFALIKAVNETLNQNKIKQISKNDYVMESALDILKKACHQPCL